jgi:CDP-diacylglycerol--glycerol-3-phosphate 3-phosphatidyltransferase
VTPRTATADSHPAPASPGARGVLTVPNALCLVRLLGSPVLVILAVEGQPAWCLGLTLALFLTDWLDGKLTILLKQRTKYGPWLDSVADLTFYAGVLLSLLVLFGDLLWREAVWIGLAVLSYAVSVVSGLIKYRRLPSYHTRLAKTSWLLMLVAVVAVFSDWSVWAVRVAMLGVLVTNLEATLITILLPVWRSNVPSVFHAIRLARAGGGAT